MIEQRASACASLRNSPWRLLLAHFALRPSLCAAERMRLIPDVIEMPAEGSLGLQQTLLKLALSASFTPSFGRL
jgi:hypothetical protein